MRVLLFGGNGWIGGMFKQCWNKLYPEDEVIVSSQRVKFENKKSIMAEIEAADRVVSMIGRTSGVMPDGTVVNNIDFCESHPRENLIDNLVGPFMLARCCEMLNKHFLYLGTGCIFSWETDKSVERRVKEEDYPDFFGSAYSIAKGQTDSLMKEFENVCNARIRMPIVNQDTPRNFISKIIRYKNIHNMPNSMTYLPEMLPILVECSRRKITGTVNCTNPGYIDHKTVLTMYKDKVDPSHTFDLVTDPEQLQLKSKRSNNVLDTAIVEGIAKSVGLPLSSITDAMTHCFDNWNR